MEQQQEILDAPTTSKVAVYNPIEAGIKAMLEKHGKVLTDPPVVTGNAQALAVVKASRLELVKFRTTLEKARKDEKAESLAYGRLVDSEAARIQAFATPLELAYDAIVTAEENRLEAIRQQELEAERQRIAGHRARIQAIKEVRETANMCRTAERVQQLIDGMPTLFDGTFEEFQDEALTAFNEVCTVLGQLLTVKVEAEQAAAELKRQQDELAAQQAEVNRKAAIQTKLTDIRMLLVKAGTAPDAAAIAYFLDRAKEIVIDDSYAEFKFEADHTLDSVCEQIAAMLVKKQQSEQEAAQQQETVDALNRREQDLQARERETAEREKTQRREAEATASKPLVARVAEAISGPRPTFMEKVNEALAPIAQDAIKAVAPRRFASRSEIDRPDDEDIVIGLAEHFDCTEAEAVAWLRDMDLDGVLANLQQVAA
jgi:hypothetical protein